MVLCGKQSTKEQRKLWRLKRILTHSKMQLMLKEHLEKLFSSKNLPDMKTL